MGRRTFDETKQWIVPACRDCNSLSGSEIFFSIPEKAKYIRKRYETKFRKALRVPTWSEDELKGMSRRFRDAIEESQVHKYWVIDRLKHLDTVSDYSVDFERPRWVELEMEELDKEHKRIKNALKRTRKKKASSKKNIPEK